MSKRKLALSIRHVLRMMRSAKVKQKYPNVRAEDEQRFIMLVHSGLTQREIAARLHVTQVAVSKRISRFRVRGVLLNRDYTLLR